MILQHTTALAKVLLCVVLLASCSKENDNLFKQSALERADEHRATCFDALTSAESGWIVHYYPQNQVHGGYTYWMRFTVDGRVEMRPEIALEDYKMFTDTSTFRVHSGQSTVLSFDTYSVLHRMADPEELKKDYIDVEIDWTKLTESPYINYGQGYEGDFEMTCQEINENNIIFTGMKRRTRISFTKVNSVNEGQEYLANQATMHSTLQEDDLAGFFLIHNGDSAEVIQNKFHFFNIYQKDTIGFYNSHPLPYVVTDEGLQFYSSVNIGGHDVKDFTWDDTENEFISEEGARLSPGITARGRFTDPTVPKIYYVDFEKSGTSFNAAVEELEDEMFENIEFPEIFTGVKDIRMIMNGYPTAQQYFNGSHRIDVYTEYNLQRKNNLYLFGTTAKSINETMFNYAIDFGNEDGGKEGFAPFHTIVNDWLYQELYGPHVYTVDIEERWNFGVRTLYYRLGRNDDSEYFITLKESETI